MPEFAVRRWLRRLVPATVLAVLIWWIAGLVGMHTRLAVDLGLALFIAAFVGLARDTGPAWTVAMPVASQPDTERAPTRDARLSYLRRTVQDAASSSSRADPARAAPMGLQRSLRNVAAHRLSRRTGHPVDPDDRAGLAARLDPMLAEYLCPTTPPPVDQRRLDEIVRRIEEL